MPAGFPYQIATTDSAGHNLNHEILTESPQNLIVTFASSDPSNQPLSVFSDGDIQLFQIVKNQDGTENTDPVFDSLPWSDYTGTEWTFPSLSYVADQNTSLSLRSTDPTNPAAPYVLSLSPGQYRLGLQAASGTASFCGLNPNVDPSQDFYSYYYDLADFSVARKGSTLSNAADLGTVGPQIQTIPGSLDLSAGQNNVALYKVTLAPGHFWRLGVELDAQRIGSGLLGALSLFDQTGSLLATRDSGTGRPKTPNDPYLFAGLNPGVYYIGVSGAGNLPSQFGFSYPGTLSQRQSGGSFNLQLVADPVSAPTRVTGFTLNWADPLDPSPTGLTVAFSGPIDVNSLLGKGTNQPPVKVLDQAGRSWALTPSGYQESLGQVSFVFDQRLPAGQYTLQVPTSGGLTDLAGRAPVGPGLLQGVLASWTVSPRIGRSSPNDLGVLWPSQHDGFRRNSTIAPGQMMVYRVVVPVSGLYKLQTTLTQGKQGKLMIVRVGPDGQAVVDPGSTNPLSQHWMYLKEGVHLFRFFALGTQPVQVKWVLKSSGVDAESLIDNGVAQTSALSLRFLTFDTPSLTPGLPPGSSTDPSTNVTPVSPPSSHTELEMPFAMAPTPPTNGVSPVPASLLVTVNSGLLGRPAAGDEHMALVGRWVPGGSVALADSSTHLIPDEFARSSSWIADRGKDASTPHEPLLPNGVPPEPQSTADATVPGAGPSSSQADLLALMKADQVTKLAASLGRWLTPLAAATRVESSADEPFEPKVADEAESEMVGSVANRSLDRGSDRIDHAELGIPTTLLLISAAAYRLRQFSVRWWRRTRGSPDASARPRSTPSRGPRFWRVRASANTRLRAPARP